MHGSTNPARDALGRFWSQNIAWVSPTTIVVITIITLSLLVFKAIRTDLDPREPPAIKPKPPVIGHLLGLMKYHAMYFKML